MNELYPDTNGNGVPDAFESRTPISEILSRDPSSIVKHADSIDPLLSDRVYRLFVGPLNFMGNTILLEIRGPRDTYGGCLIKTKDDLREFIRQLEIAGVEAFGD